jgi:hypothetical protein
MAAAGDESPTGAAANFRKAHPKIDMVCSMAPPQFERLFRAFGR